MPSVATKTPLGELIDRARTPEGLSMQDVADRANRHGFKMSKQNVSRLANDNPLGSISGDNIRGLAVALGVSERRIAAAALASMGINLHLDIAPVRQAVLDDDELGERTKRLLLAIVQEEENSRELLETMNRDDLALAARDRDVHGQPIVNRGRQARRQQDEDATASQDDGGMDPR